MYDVKGRLMSERDEEFRAFSMKLIPGCKGMIGVRTPVLRRIAKEISKDDWRSILPQLDVDCHEEKLIRGFVIASAKMDLEERLELIDSQVALMDNWAVCDMFDYKPKAHEREAYFDFASSYLDRPGEFEKRFGAVTMMKYIDEDHIRKVISLMDSVKHDGYYLKMGVAWTLSMCYVKFPDITDAYLQSCNLDDFTFNKTLQKTAESFRSDKEMKDRVRKMKRR